MTTEQIKKALQSLQSKLEIERYTYRQIKDEMELWYSKIWPFVDQAFKVTSQYLQAERVRVKHETAAWMKGIEPRGDYGAALEITRLHELYPVLLSGLRETDEELVSGLIKEIQNVTQSLEEKIYVEG